MSSDRGNSSHRLGHDRATQLAHFTAERRRRAVPRPGFASRDPDELPASGSEAERDPSDREHPDGPEDEDGEAPDGPGDGAGHPPDPPPAA